MNPYPPTVEQQMKQFYHSLSEKDRRRYGVCIATEKFWSVRKIKVLKALYIKAFNFRSSML